MGVPPVVSPPAGPAAPRLAAVEAWRALPDSASVNVVETRWAELVRALAARGVRVEIGLWSAEGAEAFAASGKDAMDIGIPFTVTFSDVA